MKLTTIRERAQDLISIKCKMLELQLEQALLEKGQAIADSRENKLEHILDILHDLAREKEIFEYIQKTLAEANK